MKVFVPMTDDLLDDQAVIRGVLVPFNPHFLEQGGVKVEQSDQTRKLANWIPETSYQAARQRLRQSS